MKNKLLLLLSILLVVSGVFGLYWVKKSVEIQNKSTQRTFDPLLQSESEIFKNIESENSERVSSLLRESKKKKPSIKEWIFKEFENEHAVVQEAMLLALGNYTDKESINFLIRKVSERENESHSLYALKGLSAHEDVLRVLSLQKISLKNRSLKFLIHYHFALFKTKSYFTDKKKDLHWLVEKGESISDSEELRLIVMGLSEYVPNFEKFHDLLKILLYKSRDEVVLNRAVIHLSVYDSGWMKVQTKKIIASENRALLKEFLARSGVFCPLNIWDAYKFYAKTYSAQEAIKIAATVNMKKAESIGVEIGYDALKLAEILKVKRSTLCY